MPHSFLQGARDFDALAARTPSGPEVAQALRNLARTWREIAAIVGEAECPSCQGVTFACGDESDCQTCGGTGRLADPGEVCYDLNRGVEQSGSSRGS